MKTAGKTSVDQAIHRLITPFAWRYFYIIEHKRKPQKPKAMKTIKILSAAFLALILGGSVSASNDPGPATKNVVPLIRAVRHHVNVHVSMEQKLCNIYQIEIRDESGQRVAPAKVYVPGVTGYDFYERGPFTGIRVAVLVIAPSGGTFSCERELFTAPVPQSGKFIPGNSYRYDLFPQTQPFRQ